MKHLPPASRLQQLFLPFRLVGYKPTWNIKYSVSVQLKIAIPCVTEMENGPVLFSEIFFSILIRLTPISARVTSSARYIPDKKLTFNISFSNTAISSERICRK